ncbi:WEB family protein At1g12150 [Olea europaea subsp. europaea]|uniref:WEB family protein At1g12150 n=1 Tax=Olea europaea subsp. europaea TaxID=158383 RepID=A0A8S0TLE2_OLEEU|nr:WEB family protein At1g12150 [Olea europaea subsp. europaea]
MEKTSLTEHERLFPKISSSSSIQELIKFLEYSFLKSDFDEVQNILTDRENSMKMERESFERDRRSIKKEIDLLEGKLKEKSKMILQLNRKIEELTNQKLGSEQIAVKYEEKIKSMNDEVEKLNCERLEAEQTVEVYKKRFEDLVAVKYEEKIKSLNDEVEKLKCEKLDADQTVEVYKKRFEDLTARFGNTEQILAKIFKVGINDLSNLANNIEKDDVNFSTSDGKKESSRNGGKWSGGNADFRKADFDHFQNERRSLNSGADEGNTLSMAYPACKSSGTGIHGLQERGGRNLVLSSQTKEAGANGYDVSQSSPGKQFTGDPGQTESRQAIIMAFDHGEQVPKNLKLTRSCSKMARSLIAGDIIEISDSEDEKMKPPLRNLFKVQH